MLPNIFVLITVKICREKYKVACHGRETSERGPCAENQAQTRGPHQYLSVRCTTDVLKNKNRVAGPSISQPQG